MSLSRGVAASDTRLDKPPELTCPVLSRLPNLDEQHIVSGIGAALENKLRPIVRLRIDGKKLRGGVRDNYEIATDYDLKFRIGHCYFQRDPVVNECSCGLRCFGSLKTIALGYHNQSRSGLV